MPKEVIIRVRRNGEMTIPKEVREEIDIKKGDFLKLIIDEDPSEFTLKKTKVV